MSARTVQDIAEETLQRVIRTETRLMTLGTKLGYDLKADDEIMVDAETCVVTVTTLDVPYTSVVKAARRAGLHKRKVTVVFEGKLIAEMLV